jgi:hypothetical protein
MSWFHRAGRQNTYGGGVQLPEHALPGKRSVSPDIWKIGAIISRDVLRVNVGGEEISYKIQSHPFLSLCSHKRNIYFILLTSLDHARYLPRFLTSSHTKLAFLKALLLHKNSYPHLTKWPTWNLPYDTILHQLSKAAIQAATQTNFLRVHHQDLLLLIAQVWVIAAVLPMW